jgi:hypothetical protein
MPAPIRKRSEVVSGAPETFASPSTVTNLAEKRMGNDAFGQPCAYTEQTPCSPGKRAEIAANGAIFTPAPHILSVGPETLPTVAGFSQRKGGPRDGI